LKRKNLCEKKTETQNFERNPSAEKRKKSRGGEGARKRKKKYLYNSTYYKFSQLFAL
jgi:hypothetical protein